MRFLPVWLLCIISIWLITILGISSCSQSKRNSSHDNVSIESINKGKELAKNHCQSCHMLPDPSWVDSKTWQKGILPNMGPRLGIFHFKNSISFVAKNLKLSRASIYNYIKEIGVA